MNRHNLRTIASGNGWRLSRCTACMMTLRTRLGVLQDPSASEEAQLDALVAEALGESRCPGRPLGRAIYQFARIQNNGLLQSYGVVRTVFVDHSTLIHQRVVADCPDPLAAEAARRLLHEPQEALR